LVRQDRAACHNDLAGGVRHQAELLRDTAEKGESVVVILLTVASAIAYLLF